MYLRQQMEMPETVSLVPPSSEIHYYFFFCFYDKKIFQGLWQTEGSKIFLRPVYMIPPSRDGMFSPRLPGLDLVNVLLGNWNISFAAIGESKFIHVQFDSTSLAYFAYNV